LFFDVVANIKEKLVKQAFKFLLPILFCGLSIYTNWFGILHLIDPYLPGSLDPASSSLKNGDNGTVQTESESEVTGRGERSSESALDTDFILCEVGSLREEITNELLALRKKLEQRHSEDSAMGVDLVLLSLNHRGQLNETTKRLGVLEGAFDSAVAEIRDRAPPPELAKIASDLEHLREELKRSSEIWEKQSALEERLQREAEANERLERKVQLVVDQLQATRSLESMIEGVVHQVNGLETVFREAIARNQQTEPETQGKERKETKNWEVKGYSSYEEYMLRPPDLDDTLWTVRLSHPEMPEDLVFPNTPARGSEEEGFIFWVRGEWRSWPTFQIVMTNPKPIQRRQ
jgi:hypothetical protein